MTDPICGHPTATDGSPCQNPVDSCPVDAHDEPPTYHAPAWVTCPCGDGRATLRDRRPITEPFSFDAAKTATHYHYRHDGCPLGGTIVAVDGAVHRRLGPVFEPARYDHADASAQSAASD